MWLTLTALALLFYILYSCIAACFRSRQHPPGPSPLPIIGNAHQLFLSNAFSVLETWHRQHGPIIRFRAGNRNVISLSTHEVVNDLLRKRSLPYSSRPKLTFGSECLTKGLVSAMMPYGDAWKRQHSLVLPLLTMRGAQAYIPVQDLESIHLVRDLLHGAEYTAAIRRFACSVGHLLTYGQRLTETNDDTVLETVKLIDDALKSINFTQAVLELFPLIDYLTRWRVGHQRAQDNSHDLIVQFASSRIMPASQREPWNWTRDILARDAGLSPWTQMCYTTFELYGASATTTSAALGVFRSVGAAFPRSVAKAQEEIDDVVGGDRLPRLNDELPYATAFIKEAFRWRAVFPIFPRATVTSDVYIGYTIAPETPVLVNTWLLNKDKAIYGDPEIFRPERWIADPSLPHAMYGFGRRACSGRHLAENSLTLAILRILWGFDIRSGQGDHCEDVSSGRGGIVFNVGEGQATVCARSERHGVVIEEAWEAVDKDEYTLLKNIKDTLQANPT